jgi:xanthine/CO dehydrogenase XdhC/CoxF family maturation factor
MEGFLKIEGFSRIEGFSKTEENNPLQARVSLCCGGKGELFEKRVTGRRADMSTYIAGDYFS